MSEMSSEQPRHDSAEVLFATAHELGVIETEAIAQGDSVNAERMKRFAMDTYNLALIVAETDK